MSEIQSSTPRRRPLARVLSVGGVALSLGLCLLCSPGWAYPTQAAPATQSARQPLQATLDNGLRVVIVPDALAPMVTTQITYKVGSYDTPQGMPGSAHALEHMMFRGADGMSGAQLNKMVGMMGADINAFTTNDATQYYLVAPSAYLGVLLEIESRRMRGARIDQASWAGERGAIEQEVSGNISQPGYLAFERAEQLLYADTGYAQTPLGTRPSFGRTTADDLRKFYDQWYVPNNALLVIAGDVDPSAALAQVKERFGGIARGTTPQRQPLQLKPVQAQTVDIPTPKGTGSVGFMYRMPGTSSPDFAAAKVLLGVLGNSRSPVSELAAQGKVLSTDVDVQTFSMGGVGMVAAGFQKGVDPAPTRALLDATINQLLKDGVSAELVAAEKRAELARAEFNKNSALSLATSWSQALVWHGLGSPQEFEQQVRQVTVEDVNRLARSYLDPKARVVIIQTPDDKGVKPADSTGFGGSESLGGDKDESAVLPAWAASQLETLSLPHWTLAPTDMRLSNGIRLIVQPTKVSKTVTLMGRVDNNSGMQEPAGKDGVGQLLEGLFDYGSTSLDRKDYHAALDEIAATRYAGTNFYLAVPSAHVERGLQLLADNELHPSLRQADFQVQRDILSRSLAGQLQSPMFKMQHATMKALVPAGDPMLRQATPETVDKLTLDDVRAYFRAAYRPDLTTMVMVGDITPERARALVEQYFGSWKAVGPRPDVIPPPVPVNPPSSARVVNPYASQDDVRIGQMLALDLGNNDRYALTLGNDVLGGNGFASRLMNDIRVKHGYAYGASSGLSFERSRTMFGIGYGSDPDKVPLVNALVKQNLQRMRDTPISAEELDSARQAQIRSIPLRVASVRGIAYSLLDWGYQGLPLNEPMVAAQHYLTLTPEQVQAAFRKYVDPERMAQIIQGPAADKP